MYVYQFQWNPSILAPVLFGGLLPRPEDGIFFIGGGAVALVAYCFWRLVTRAETDTEKEIREGLPRLGWQWLFLFLVFTGTYIMTARWTDEVFLHLLQTRNLVEHGLFSYSPVAKADGTPDGLFSLMQLPFAWSRVALVRANYVLCWLIGFAHVALAFRIFRSESGTRAIALPLALIAAAGVAWIEPLAYGFGNGLVSLVFLFAATALLNRIARGRLFWACLLPLIRPEAVFLSGLLIATAIIQGPIPKKRAFLLIAGTVASFCAYAVLFHGYYGYWLPTPYLFRMGQFAGYLSRVFQYTSAGSRTNFDWLAATGELRLFAFGALILAFPFGKNTRRFRPYAILGTALILMAVLCSILAVGDNPTFRRQFAPTYWYLLIWSALRIGAAVGDRLPRAAPGILVLLAMVLFVPGLSDSYGQLRDYRTLAGTRLDVDGSGRLDHMIYIAKALDRVVPDSWVIGLTQIAIFPFFSERHGQFRDYWGYTNRRIAGSRICASTFKPFLPELFTQEKPDILWMSTNGPKDPYGYPFPDVASAEHLLRATGLERSFDQISDLRPLVRDYDFLWLLHGKERATVLLVRKDRSEMLRARLIEDGALLAELRPLRMPELTERRNLAEDPFAQPRFSCF